MTQPPNSRRRSSPRDPRELDAEVRAYADLVAAEVGLSGRDRRAFVLAFTWGAELAGEGPLPTGDEVRSEGDEIRAQWREEVEADDARGELLGDSPPR